MPDLSVARCPPGQLDGILDDLARLRATVFREWPYLYDAQDAAYERAYLDVYRRSPMACVVLARDAATPGKPIVGAATALPLLDETPEMRAPFEARGVDCGPFFYFGESVLLQPFRGQGAGVAFFTLREQAAREAGATFATFCAVRRAPDHPARPADAAPLDDFWRRRGYAPLPGVSCVFPWREVGGQAEIPHTLDFWARSLTDAPLPTALTEVR